MPGKPAQGGAENPDGACWNRTGCAWEDEGDFQASRACATSLWEQGSTVRRPGQTEPELEPAPPRGRRPAGGGRRTTAEASAGLCGSRLPSCSPAPSHTCCGRGHQRNMMVPETLRHEAVKDELPLRSPQMALYRHRRPLRSPRLPRSPVSSPQFPASVNPLEGSRWSHPLGREMVAAALV